MLKNLSYKKFEILKKIYSREKLILIIKKNNKKKILKIFKKKNKSYNVELKGYKEFKVREIIHPKVKKVRLFKDYNALEIEFIDGKKINFIDVILISNLVSFKNIKNISLDKYLFNLYKFFTKEKKLFKINFFNKILKNKFNIYYLNLSLSHGDFSGYNIIKRKDKYYIFDFEKFGERIIFFDQINIFFVIFLIKINYLFKKKNSKFKKYIILNIFKIFRIFLFFVLSKKIKEYNIDFKTFNLYMLLFLFEKNLTFSKDLKYLNSKIEIQKVKRKIIIMHLLENFLISEKL